jgi:hypothetical protein
MLLVSMLKNFCQVVKRVVDDWPSLVDELLASRMAGIKDEIVFATI